MIKGVAYEPHRDYRDTYFAECAGRSGAIAYPVAKIEKNCPATPGTRSALLKRLRSEPVVTQG